MSVEHLNKFSLFALLLTSFGLATGCDGVDYEEMITIEGRVTDDNGYSKRQGRIEEAVVTAVAVGADGSLDVLPGDVLTDAGGRFSLTTEGAASNVLMLEAEKEGFSSKALVYLKNSSGSSVRAMPLTSESRAEADVYVEARKQASAGALTVADVAALVDAQVAAELEAEQATAADVAAAIRSSAEADAEYVRAAVPDVRVADARGQKRGAFVVLQGELHASGDASAQAEAVQAFEARLARAYVEAGASAEAQAKASLAARSALIQASNKVSSNARLALRKRAEIIAALATAHAVEAGFKAEGAAEARMNALAQARATLLASLRAATSASAIAEAHAAYQSRVEAELNAAFDVSAVALTSARASLGAAKQALSATIDTADSAKAVATAYTTFYASAHTSAMTSLGGDVNADLAATVLVLLSAQ